MGFASIHRYFRLYRTILFRSIENSDALPIRFHRVYTKYSIFRSGVLYSETKHAFFFRVPDRSDRFT